MEKKNPFKSVTLWVNMLGGAAVAVLTVIGDVTSAPWVAMALAGANFLLRFKTTQPIV